MPAQDAAGDAVVFGVLGVENGVGDDVGGVADCACGELVRGMKRVVGVCLPGRRREGVPSCREFGVVEGARHWDGRAMEHLKIGTGYDV